MSDRDTSKLDRAVDGPEGEKPNAAPARAPRVAETPPPLVELNYPEPTALSLVVRDVAKWSRLSFVMEPSVNAKIQIFSPRRMPTAEAYELFLASLAVVNLRAVQMGNVVKIVPITYAVSA